MAGMALRSGKAAGAALAMVAPLLCGAVIPAPARAASFDCARASSIAEHLICDTPALSSADERMAAAYKALMTNVRDSDLGADVAVRLRDEQRAWVAQRDERCGLSRKATDAPTATQRGYIADCLLESVKSRTERLERMRDGFPTSALVEPRSIRESNTLKHYEIDAAYPTLPASMTGAEAFNRLSEGLVRPIVETFRKESADDTPPNPDMRSELDIEYDVSLASPRLVSIEFTVYDYPAGAAHGTTVFPSLHVDLVHGRALTVNDLFRPDSGWRKAVTDLAFAELKRQAKRDDFTIYDTAWKNAEEVVGDLSNWRLEAGQAVIVFAAYTVAAYAVGPREVALPYAVLKPFLKPDGPLPPRAP